jgi:imidazolonepropionase-like amidohydrolase
MFRTAFATFIALPLLFTALVTTLPTPEPRAEEPTASRTTAIVGVRVFDGETLLPGTHTVVIAEGRVAAIGANVRAPRGATIVDGAGRTLLPGLIDAHTHVYSDVLGDALRFGVVAELDMFSPPAGLARLQEGRDDGRTRDRSDFYSAGMLATAPNGHGTEYGVPVATLTAPDQAQAWVDARIAEGSDYIKIVYEPPAPGYSTPSIDRATLNALVQAAHARGKLAVVHAQRQASARDAVAAGADGLVHVFFDPIDADFLSEIVRRDVFVTPTLSVFEGFAGGSPWGEAAFRSRLSAAQRAMLTPPQARPSLRAQFANGQANVRALANAGVDILAGTDAPNPGTAHGATLHRELMLLVESGLTPIQALRAATSAPAARFRLDGRGRIARGVRADLVLVEGDPTRDITATQRIVAIWKNGAEVALAAPASKTEPLAAGLVSNFDSGAPSSAWGVDWTATTDAIMGGRSQAALSITPEGALRVDGEVASGGFTAWAGASVAFASDWSVTRDLSGLSTLRFRARGAPGRYRVMAFGAAMAGAPPEQSFEATSAWTEVALSLDGFAGLERANMRAFAIVAGPQARAFHLEIDDVRLD